MAGDWIKMRTNLDTDPRVVEIAAQLNMTELHVIGCLWKLWAWANDHSIDGNAIRVTHVTLDRYTSVPGFADALRNVGWLEGRDTALTFPRFVEHNGQTAKKRAETKERVANYRNAKSVTSVTQKVLPEKRREEKRREVLNTSLGGEENSDSETPQTTKLATEQEQPPPLREGRLLYDPCVVPMPGTLGTPQFRAAWVDWCDYLVRKHVVIDQDGATSELFRLEKFGPTVAASMIEFAKRKQWKSLPEQPPASDKQRTPGGKQKRKYITAAESIGSEFEKRF
jgi:hypothetical protein